MNHLTLPTPSVSPVLHRARIPGESGIRNLKSGILIVLFCLCSWTQAAVIYSGIQNIAIDTTFVGTYVDVENTNNATNHSTSTITGWDINLFFGGVGMMNEANFQPVRASGVDPFSAMQNLALGQLISAASTFATGAGGSGDFGSEHVGFSAGQFQPNVDGYIGFRLNGSNYGWMRVSFTFDDPGAVIRDWAYDDSGMSIFAGSVPEPSRAVLLMVGLMSGMLQRRRVTSVA